MNREQIEHTLRAAGDILDEKHFIIIGSQSILGKYPNAPKELLTSREVDMYPKSRPLESPKLDAIGEGTWFDKSNGYFVDSVGEETAILPKGWKGRLVNLTGPMTNGVIGLCLDPHDLFVSKMVAGREKDIEYCKVMIEYNLVGKDQVLKLACTISNTTEDPNRKDRVVKKIENIYQGVDVSKTTHVNELNGNYIGKILSVSDTVAQQDLGRGKLTFHELSKLDQYPIAGRTYKIQYNNNGSASVKEIVRNKDKDLGR